MKREEIVNKLKAKAETEIQDLRKSVRKLMKDFCKDAAMTSSTEIRVVDSVFEGKLVGTEIIENISVFEKSNDLFSIEVVRSHYVSEKETEEASADNFININLHWNDNSDHLRYTADYYPDMGNESVTEEIKALIKAANLIMENAWTDIK